MHSTNAYRLAMEAFIQQSGVDAGHEEHTRVLRTDIF